MRVLCLGGKVWEEWDEEKEAELEGFNGRFSVEVGLLLVVC